jgi:uncharacterized RDD family membrane protein YckC
VTGIRTGIGIGIGSTDCDLKGLPTPALTRRLACFVYEGVLLFGVVMAAGLVYGIGTGQRHALVGLNGLQAFLFAIIGIYFVWFWSKSGQTLAMQTWRIRLLTSAGRPVGKARAAFRYLLSWLWFLPALVTIQTSGLKGAFSVFTTLAVGALVYAALARLNPHGQYLHDALCGTRLVSWRPQRGDMSAT